MSNQLALWSYGRRNYNGTQLPSGLEDTIPVKGSTDQFFADIGTRKALAVLDGSPTGKWSSHMDNQRNDVQ